jgi:hypothetical protein
MKRRIVATLVALLCAGCGTDPSLREDLTPVATLTVVEQTAEGWCARLTLDNRGPTAIESWTAVVDINQDELVSVYGGDPFANGSTLTLYSLAPIPAESSHDAWICATSWHGVFVAPQLGSVDW